MIDARVEQLRATWAQWWPGADTAAMAADVLARAPAGLEVLAGGEVALVLADAARVVKVQPRGHADDAFVAAEPRALVHWAPSGVVPRVHEVRDDGFTYVMDRIDPGTTADDLAFEDRLDLLGALAARLHACWPADLPRLEDGYARGWGPLPVGGDPVALHADLHGGNALRAADGWRAIDPHAVVGDRHADVWALIDPLAPAPAGAREARAWIARYAQAADLDPRRAAWWVAIRAAAEAHHGGDGDAAWVERLRAWVALLAH